MNSIEVTRELKRESLTCRSSTFAVIAIHPRLRLESGCQKASNATCNLIQDTKFNWHLDDRRVMRNFIVSIFLLFYRFN